MADFFEKIFSQYANKPAFATRNKNGTFEIHTYKETWDKATALALSLQKEGVSHKDHIGLFSDNRYEWALCDIAIILCGAADVPRGSDITEEEIRYIIPHSEMKIAIVENDALISKFQKTLSEKVPRLIVIETAQEENSNVMNLTSLIEKGMKLLENKENQILLKKKYQSIKKNDLFTLIYTSGTTGKPKGVMLTHENILSQIENIPLAIDYEVRITSILPVWHIFERIFELISMTLAACTYYSSVKTLREDLKNVKPGFMASAPRLWESIYSGIMSNVAKSSPIKRAMFFSAVFFADQYCSALRSITGKNLQLEAVGILEKLVKLPIDVLILVITFIPWKVLDAIVLKQIRKATGGQLKGTISGGGALPLHVDRFFNNIGIPVYEGYGLTETSPVIAVRTPEHLVMGTVGPLYAQTFVKIIDMNSKEIIWSNEKGLPKKIGVKGEIHVRGPQVMKGYFKNEEGTKAVLHNDWFNTGDLGLMTANNCLKIVGRSKETIVLLNGENVEPIPIENKLQESVYIEQCIVVGQDQKNLGVLIIPSLTALDKYGKNYTELKNNKEVQELIRLEIARLISTENGFKSFEKVKNLLVLEKAFEPGKELTAKLSLKRHYIHEAYSHEINSLYKD